MKVRAGIAWPGCIYGARWGKLIDTKDKDFAALIEQWMGEIKAEGEGIIEMWPEEEMPSG